MTDPFLKAACWDELPDEAKAALRDLKIGETTNFTIRDDENPLLGHEYRLTVTKSVEITKEEYDGHVVFPTTGELR